MGYKICKYCGSEMNSQGIDIYTSAIRLECLVCPTCKAVFDEFMDIKYNNLSERCRWWNPKTKEFEYE